MRRHVLLDHIFSIREKGSTVRTELLGGLTTFLTMSYIIFVNPAIISKDFAGNPTGLSFEAAMLATCLSAAVATIIMGLVANYPIAQAPGMGENYFFVSVVMSLAAQGVADAWRVALGIVFISGVLFLLLSLLPLREKIINAVSPSLKNGIAVGIGLFIAFIGLRNAGIVISEFDVLKMNPNILNFDAKTFKPDYAIFFLGLILITALHARKVKGAILIGIVVCAFVSFLCGATKISGVFGLPKDHAFLAMDLRTAFSMKWVAFIVVFLFMDVFDTMGTLIGVGEAGGFIHDDKLPRAGRAMISDAAGTVVGALTGTSTVTSYIESAVGVQYGARTGLANLATGILFLFALFIAPLAAAIGNYAPITAPALVIVGAMMFRNVQRIGWDDPTEGIPAFMAMIGIPLTYSISSGLALGFISYPLVKVISGRGREVSWVIYAVAVILIVRYMFVKM